MVSIPTADDLVASSTTVTNSVAGHYTAPVGGKDDNLLADLAQTAAVAEVLSHRTSGTPFLLPRHGVDSSSDIGNITNGIVDNCPSEKQFTSCTPDAESFRPTRNRVYATFRKKATPCLSGKLPTISSPVCVTSSRQHVAMKFRLSNGHEHSSEAKVDPSGSGDLPSQNHFEIRRRTRSLIHSPSPDPVSQDGVAVSHMLPSPGTTSWVEVSRRASSCATTVTVNSLDAISKDQLACREDDSEDTQISSSTNSGMSVGGSTTVLLRLSLDQRRRHIELNRQRVKEASHRAGVNRRHAAFQRLLQQHQQRHSSESLAPTSVVHTTSQDSHTSLEALSMDGVAVSACVASSDTLLSSSSASSRSDAEYMEKPYLEDLVAAANTLTGDIELFGEESQAKITPVCIPTPPSDSPPRRPTEPVDEPSTPTAVNSIADSQVSLQICTPESEPNLSACKRLGSPPTTSVVSPKPPRGRRRAADCPPVTAHNRFQAYSARRHHSPSPSLDFDRSSDECATSMCDCPFPGTFKKPQTSASSPTLQRRRKASLTSRSMISMSHGRPTKESSARHVAVPGGLSRPACAGCSVDWEHWRRRSTSGRHASSRFGGPGWLKNDYNDGGGIADEGEEAGFGSFYYSSDDEYDNYRDETCSVSRGPGYRYDNWDNASECSHPYRTVCRREIKRVRSRHTRPNGHTLDESYSHLRRRPVSPSLSVASTNAVADVPASLINPSTLAQINRNLSDLQLGLERLSKQQQQILSSNLNSEDKGSMVNMDSKPLNPQQPSPKPQVLPPRATWDLDGSTSNLSVNAHPVTSSPNNEKQPNDDETAVTSTSSAVSRSTPNPIRHIPVDIEVSSAMASEEQKSLPPLLLDGRSDPRHSQTEGMAPTLATDPVVPTLLTQKKLFFIGFDDPDPQRTQRKCDQLEARRAAEKAAVAQQLQSLREQEHHQRLEERRKATDREPTQQHTSVFKELPDPTSKLQRPQPSNLNLYPVRSGAVASVSLSSIDCSQTSVMPSSSCALPTKSVSISDRLLKVRRSTPHSLSNNTRPCVHSPTKSIGLRGNAKMTASRSSGDGQAGELAPDEEIPDQQRQAKCAEQAEPSRTFQTGGPLSSGLSLSSLHRLEAATTGSGSPGHSSNQLRLYVKPKAKSNRMVIVNAIGHCCLAGTVNEPVKQAALKELAATEGTHFMILFRDARLQYRAVYFFDLDLEELRIICGTGPRRITHDMVNRFYKYNSGGKHFSEITSTSHLSPAVDAITIHDYLWSRSGGQSAAINLLCSRML